MPREELVSENKLMRASRIPRAPNLKFAKRLLRRMSYSDSLGMDDYRGMASSVIESNRSQYTNEYLKLLVALGFVRKINKVILVSDTSRKISKNFTEDDALSDYEMGIFLERLVENGTVRFFLDCIFGYDIKNCIWLKRSQPFDAKFIALRYIQLTGLSVGTGRREARLLTNWLGQVGLVEQSYTGKYFLTVGTLQYETFERVLEEEYSQLEASERSGIGWVEIAPLQANICEEYNISKKVFDYYFRCLIEKSEGRISVSPGSAGLKDVRRFGVKLNNRLIYYMKFNR
jgi:hypothetical protein